MSTMSNMCEKCIHPIHFPGACPFTHCICSTKTGVVQQPIVHQIPELATICCINAQYDKVQQNYVCHVHGRSSVKNAVNHPMHYGGDTIHEHIKCIEAWGLTQSYALGNATKYLCRAGKKSDDTIQDLEKAVWYINYEIERLKRDRS